MNQYNKWIRYGLLASPFIACGLVTTCVVVNSTVRETMEQNFPKYVEFLREHIGFDDEDLVEDARIAAVEQLLRKPVNIKVFMSNGAVVDLHNIDGQRSILEVLKDVETLQCDTVTNYTFVDDINPEIGSTAIETSSCDTGSNDTCADGAVKPSSNITSVVMKGEEFVQSAWDVPLCDMQTSQSEDTSSVLLTPLSRDIIMQRFLNYAPFTTHNMKRYGLLKYAEHGEKSSVVRTQSYGNHKVYVKESIAKLETRLLQYEAEMRMGSRDMDSVMADIRRTKAEIVQLRRKHLNTFYYF